MLQQHVQEWRTCMECKGARRAWGGVWTRTRVQVRGRGCCPCCQGQLVCG